MNVVKGHAMGTQGGIESLIAAINQHETIGDQREGKAVETKQARLP